jgi:hypothetical protein
MPQGLFRGYVSTGKETADPSTALRSGPKTFPRKGVHTEISPLRFASVEMTKGRAALPGRAVAEQKPFLSS